MPPPAAGGPPWARIGAQISAESAATAAMKSQTRAGPSQIRNRLTAFSFRGTDVIVAAGRGLLSPAGAEPGGARPARARPAVPGPAVPRPAVAGPAVAAPAVARPAVPRPSAARPARARPARAGPLGARPAVPVPAVAGPGAAVPAAAPPAVGPALEPRHVGRVERLAEDVLLPGEHDAVAGQVVLTARDLQRSGPRRVTM